MGTEHRSIMRAEEDFLPWDELKPLLDQILDGCQRLDCPKVREGLLRAVTGYSPTKEVEDLVWRQRNVGVRVATARSDAARAAAGAARGSAALGRPRRSARFATHARALPAKRRLRCAALPQRPEGA